MTSGSTSDPISRPVDRRRFLQGAMALGAGAALGPFAALGERVASGAEQRGRANGRGRHAGGYGPLRPTRDQTTGLELLALPAGFSYLTHGWTGDRMTDGTPTPSAHDGMAAFRESTDRIRLVRNHERGAGAPFAAPAQYDPAAGGGTTNLSFDPVQGQFVESYASLGGTIRNCAGGTTPWGTWLTCEETTEVVGGTRHGYVFEVPADGVGNPEPIRAMGRFSHEAAAVDPRTGIVYLTEDTGSSLLYRFVPADRHDLHAGGTLQAMVLEGTTDTRTWSTGTSAPIAGWVTIPDADPAPGAPSTATQGRAGGAAVIARGEGAWYGNGVVYVVSTSGGPAGQGQVFALDPHPTKPTFTALYTSPSGDVLNAPDNVTVSPRGGLVLCEDGGGTEYLHGLTTDGDIFRLAENTAVLSAEVMAAKGYRGTGDHRGSEWAGACFDPQRGDWLFANLQSPGITFAITGPWKDGAL